MADLSRVVTEHLNRKTSRLSEPAEGLSLTTATEARALHIRKAVGHLAAGFDDSSLSNILDVLFAPRWECEFESQQNEAQYLKVRAAWNLVCIWLLAQGDSVITAHSDFRECEEWFVGNINVPAPLLSSIISHDNLKRAHGEIAKVSIDQDLWDLFPYVLEEHGPGSRASVLRDPTTKNARAAKKRQGIFYTPSDAADYMTEHAMINYTGDLEKALCLDPTCGTGVFLRSLCDAAEKRACDKSFDRFKYVINNLFGCDISIHAVEACTFVMLQHCLADVNKLRLSPWTAWHAIRMNIACVDSLTLASVETHNNLCCGPNLTLRTIIKNLLISENTSWVAPEKVFSTDGEPSCNYPSLFPYRQMIRIDDLFPEAARGFNILVGNPPYSLLGEKNDYLSLSCEYGSLSGYKASSRYNLFLLFVETMWRLTIPGNSSSAMVTPLSIAYNGSEQYKNCRSTLGRKGGIWQFAFFDREPHALFGEEVKTRNSILFRVENDSTPQRGETPLIETGPLRKWTSRSRKHLFESIRFTRLGLFDITKGIPKIDGILQTKIFLDLLSRGRSSHSFFSRLSTCNLDTVINKPQAKKVYIGGTAYNFLNVFHGFFTDAPFESPISESPVHCLEFTSASEASAAFAILSSRLSFWLWHAQTDGFHVPSWFIRNLPFDEESFSDEQLQRLSEIGALLWEKVYAQRFININGGKRTYAFRSLSFNEDRDSIDCIVIKALGLPPEFALELNNFVRKTVVVDENDLKRQYLQNYFEKD